MRSSFVKMVLSADHVAAIGETDILASTIGSAVNDELSLLDRHITVFREIWRDRRYVVNEDVMERLESCQLIYFFVAFFGIKGM